VPLARQIIRAYEYLFYKLYLFERMLLDPVPDTPGFCLMVILQLANLSSLVFVLNHFFGSSIGLSRPTFWCALVLLALPQYFLLLHGQRFRRVLRQFVHESERQSVIGGLVVAAYVVFSVALFFWSLSLGPPNV
jgi:hypothetical protein